MFPSSGTQEFSCQMSISEKNLKHKKVSVCFLLYVQAIHFRIYNNKISKHSKSSKMAPWFHWLNICKHQNVQSYKRFLMSWKRRIETISMNCSTTEHLHKVPWLTVLPAHHLLNTTCLFLKFWQFRISLNSQMVICSLLAI